jgi:hypothetical protein
MQGQARKPIRLCCIHLPILNNMLSCFPSYGDQQLFSVVSVEATNADGQVGIVESFPLKKAGDASDIEIGQGVALEIKSFGSSVLRGRIVCQHEDGEWIVEFTNMRKFKLLEKQVMVARNLFEKEVAYLVQANTHE